MDETSFASPRHLGSGGDPSPLGAAKAGDPGSSTSRLGPGPRGADLHGTDGHNAHLARPRPAVFDFGGSDALLRRSPGTDRGARADLQSARHGDPDRRAQGASGAASFWLAEWRLSRPSFCGLRQAMGLLIMTEGCGPGETCIAPGLESRKTETEVMKRPKARNRRPFSKTGLPTAPTVAQISSSAQALC